MGPPEVLDQIRRSGVPVVLVDDRQTLAAVSEHIRAVAAALGVPGAGAKLAARVNGEIGKAAGGGPAPGCGSRSSTCGAARACT